MKRCFFKILNVILILPLFFLNFLFQPIQRSLAEKNCDVNIADAEKLPSRFIGVVLDDSWSMFWAKGQPIDRWSQAKYAVEVLAALLEENDQLHIYLMSDFDRHKSGSDSANAALILRGSDPASSNVEKVHQLQMRGYATPYTSVKKTFEDVKAANVEEKWLIVIADGQFDGEPNRENESRSNDDVQKDLESFTQDEVSVQFLSITNQAMIEPKESINLYSENATPGTSELLSKMNIFSNRIYGRTEISMIDLSFNADIEMSELVIFAQGDNANPELTNSGGAEINPNSQVSVSWADNQPVNNGSSTIESPKVNQSLVGQILAFRDLKQNQYKITNGDFADLHAFIKPKLAYDVSVEKDGQAVPLDQPIISDEYQIKYGILDSECNLMESSELLENVQSDADITDQAGKPLKEDLKSGDSFSLTPEAAAIKVNVTYGRYGKTDRSISITVEPELPPVVIESKTYSLSKLNDYTAADGSRLRYKSEVDGKFEPIEWNTELGHELSCSTSQKVVCEILVDQEGFRVVLPKSYDGDIFDTDSGEITFTFTGERIENGNAYLWKNAEGGPFTLTVTIVDDLSLFDRALNWLSHWWWALIAAFLIIGYLAKARFPVGIKKDPAIVGRPARIGVRAISGQGKFHKNGLISWLPYFSDRATLKLTPSGVYSAFPIMNLKAKRRGMLELTNLGHFQNLKQDNKVSVLGQKIDQDTKSPFRFGVNNDISAITLDQKFTLNLKR
ncbi:MAG: hypothetical protein LBC43_01780 [Bifidobacteriaceae bacterium]|jgi:hypothetical protein|nr:hypothetical protein [Bifidobacteriaceae bacterium]